VGSLTATPDRRTDTRLSVRVSDDEFHYPTDAAGQVSDSNQFQTERNVLASLELGRRIADRLEVRLLATALLKDGALDDRADGPADTLGFYGYVSDYSSRRVGADLRANVTAWPGLVVTAGATLEEQRERTHGESLSEFGSFPDSLAADRTNGAGYLQLHAATPLGIVLTGGARLDRNERFGDFATYRAGVLYHMPTATRVRAAVGRGFKEPTFYEQYSTSPFALGNPELAPERVTSWEVGAEQPVNRWLTAGLTYFAQRFRDLIQYTGAVPAGEPNFANVAAANATGIEVEVGASPHRWFRLDAAYTWLRTEVTNAGFDSGPGATFRQGGRLLRRPVHRGSLVASYAAAGGALSVRALYVGRRDDLTYAAGTPQPVSLAAYVQIDAAADLPLLRTAGGGSISATVRIDNLLDHAYQEVTGFPAPGRVMLVGIRAGVGSQ
jgi:vitamin B12 transporter